MTIAAMRLHNFRGFEDVSLGMKPLTVLLGPNSSGKSSFSHPLAALAHCQQLYSGRRDASLTPRTVSEARDWPIDLGEYTDLATSGAADRIRIGILTTEGWVDFGFGLVPPNPKALSFSFASFPPTVDTATTGSMPASEHSRVVIPSGDYVSKVTTQGPILPEPDLRLEIERINEQQWRARGLEVLIGLDGLLPVAVQHPTGTDVKLNATSVRQARSLLEHLTYLRASRKRATRGYHYYKGNRASVGYAGEKAASVLFDLGAQIRDFPMPPSTSGGVVSHGTSRNGLEWDTADTSLQDAVGAWLSHMKLGAGASATLSERYGPEFVDVRVRTEQGGMRDITEVGFGISQVLPVVVAGLLQPTEGMLIVDLPEAHLHPRPQADIADLFCAMAMNGRTVLIETHSEPFFHRLRLRAAMDSALQNNVAVYFIDAPVGNRCSEPRQIGLTFDDELRWPAGFLQEGLEAEVQIGQVRRSRSENG